MSPMELRYLPAGAIELRERAGRLPTIRGLAVVYNSLSAEIGHAGRTFRELVRPKAFAASISSGSDIIARFNHDGFLGRISDGSLRLTQDTRGVTYEIDPADDLIGREAIAAIRAGKVRGSSFSMIVDPGGDSWRHDRGLIREIRSARLIEVSPVESPAYRATEVGLVSTESLIAMQMRLDLAARE
jgi:HK97 family phage prohead protease